MPVAIAVLQHGFRHILHGLSDAEVAKHLFCAALRIPTTLARDAMSGAGRGRSSSRGIMQAVVWKEGGGEQGERVVVVTGGCAVLRANIPIWHRTCTSG